MKKIIFLLIFMFLFFLPTAVFAAEIQSGNNLQIDEPKKDLYLFGQSVATNAEIAGDLTVFAADASINKPVQNSVFLAAGRASISGPLKHHLRVFSGNAYLDNETGGDVIIFASDMTLSKRSKVVGDLIVFSGNVNLNGTVEKNVKIYASSVDINSNILGNAEVHADQITISKDTRISGKLHYFSKDEASINSDAQIKGGVEFTKTEKSSLKNRSLVTLTGLTNYLLSVLGVFALAILVYLLIPNLLNKIIENSTKKTLRAFGIGLGTYIVAPLIFLILMVSVVGITLGLTFAFALVFLSFISYAIAAIFTGHLVIGLFSKARREKVDLSAMLLGSVILPLFGIIPIIGGPIRFILVAIALGSLVDYFLTLRGESQAENAREK